MAIRSSRHMALEGKVGAIVSSHSFAEVLRYNTEKVYA